MRTSEASKKKRKPPPSEPLEPINLNSIKMANLNLFLVVLLVLTVVSPSVSISRWFSSSYHDLRVTLRRYGHCVGELSPLRSSTSNDTEYLISKMRIFLDQTHYDNEHLANVTMLMNSICRSDLDSNYTISVNIDVSKYNDNETGKLNRCRAIEEALDAMFPVFRRVALNKTEPLDFSLIQFYPNPNSSASYNLTDLINTSWIKSNFTLEHACRITDSIREYVRLRSSHLMAQDRSQAQQAGYVSSLVEFLDRLLDPILGLQRRLYWESNNSFERVYSGISSGVGAIRDGLGQRYKSARDRVSSYLQPSSSNVTASKTAPNQTATLQSPVPTTRVNKAAI